MFDFLVGKYRRDILPSPFVPAKMAYLAG